MVKKAGLSKGGIYLYFSDIDELLIETINTILESYRNLSFAVNIEEDDIEEGLISIFNQLGDYIEETPPIIGKIRFELGIYMVNNPQKMETFLPNIRLQQTGAEFISLVSGFISKGIEKKVFRKDLKMDVIISNIMIYVDGMSEFITRMKAYNGPKLNSKVSIYFEQFIKSQILEWK